MMPLTSDISIDASKFDPVNVSDATKKANALLADITKGPRWWGVGIQKYRQMRDQGQTPLPKPVYLTEAVDATVPSRETGRDIRCVTGMSINPTMDSPARGFSIMCMGADSCWQRIRIPIVFFSAMPTNVS